MGRESKQGREREPGHPAREVVLYDGECAFCTGATAWACRRGRSLDPEPLGTAVARQVVAKADPDIDFDSLPDSIVLVDRDGVHTESDAVLRIARRLPLPLRAVGILAEAIPRTVRDGLYRAFASRRRRFGRLVRGELHQRP